MLGRVAEFGGHRLNAKVFNFSAKGGGGGVREVPVCIGLIK